MKRPRLKGTRVHQVRRRRAALVAGVAVGGALLLGLLWGGSPPPEDVKPARRTFSVPPPPIFGLGSKAEDSQPGIDRARAFTPYVAFGSPRKRRVALTFDDGPGPLTFKFARLLKRKRVPATFFVVGRQFKNFEEAVHLENRLGFTVGNHTENHVFLRGHPAREQRQEIRESAAKMRLAGVPFVRLFRPPGRSFDSSTFKVLEEVRLLMVLWTVDSRDYTRPGTPAIVKNVLSAIRPGAIVLMHDGGGDRSQTLAALPTIISTLRRRHYEFVSVPELLAADPPPRQQRLPAPGPR